ncbi:hypothetical protein LMG18101_04907 [Ralstonia flaminis]|uniref:Surface-adhesin protein E-like domain-containing protein n=2 Tax=Ralstonia flaminis TaxID=3058597 RepID=A0ABM9KAR7_9RALS|nr:hypothetical protein LMG18101_04907 [Ralstonia sp. LMG 18101]
MVQGVMKYEAPIEFNCGARTFRSAWTDGTLDGKRLPRAYGTPGRASGRYTPTGFVPTRGMPAAESMLNWACQLPVKPERLVNLRRAGNGILIQMDASSFSKTGTTASFWTRYDYPKITFDPPYDAPYDSKREFVQVNCAKKTYRLTVGYDFTPEGAVTDGIIEQNDPETPFDSTDDYAIAINEVACGKPINPATFAGIGGETLRVKAPIPGDLDMGDVASPPAVLATAAKLTAVMPSSQAVSLARITVATTHGGQPEKSTVYVVEPKKDGTTRVREIYTTFTVDREMMGIVQLKSKMRSDLSNSRDVTLTQSLEVDAPKWAPEARLSYHSEVRTIPTDETPSKLSQNCTIGQPIEASRIHSAFSGLAWPMDCLNQKGDRGVSYYIEELRYDLVIHAESKDYGTWDYTVSDVSIQR